MSPTDELADLLDRLIPNPEARERAYRELARLADGREVDSKPTEGRTDDPWTARARPAFLYVMYTLLLWSIPMGLLAAIRPALADAMARGMTNYLAGIPEPMWALFGTGYLGYTAARTWGKVKGAE